MSSTDGDASSRLDAALADVFSASPTLPDRSPRPIPPPTTDDDWGVDDDADDEYELPQIVPATEHEAPPTPASPTVPPRTRAPSAPTPAPAAPARTTPAPTTATPAAPATSWSDHLSAVPAGAQGAGLRAPGRRPRVRRVTRVLRHIDPWSTFKVALLFSFVAYLVALTSGVLLWRVADATGTLDNVERWFTQFGWETFELKGGEIFRNAWIIGLFGAVALTGALVLLATLFNLVSDIVGGVRLTVLEEEVVERTVSSTRRYVVRRSPVATADEDWDVDGDEAAGSGTSPTTPRRAPRDGAAATSASPMDDWSVDDDADDDDDGSDVDDDAIDAIDAIDGADVGGGSGRSPSAAG